MEGFDVVATGASLIPSPAIVVGTYKEDGSPNFATAAWAGTACSKPQIISVSFREATLTHGLITKQKEFTISLCSADMAAEVDFFGSKTGRDLDKAAHMKLHVQKATKVNAPYCTEFKIVYQCRLFDVKCLGLHTVFYGEVVELNAQTCVMTDGVPDIMKVDPLVFSGYTRSYYHVGGGGGKVADAFSVHKKFT